MPAPQPLVLLLDLDNTLFDSDGMKADMGAFLARSVGEAARARFWMHYEEVRRERGVVSYPEALDRLQRELPETLVYVRGMDYLIRYPYRERLLPGALAALRHLRRFGPLVILSDGEPWFQLKKLTDSGIARAVNGRVLLFPRKLERIAELRARYPAARYALFDDKPALLADMKARLGDELIAVWLCQGAYAAAGWRGPPPDLTLHTIADAVRLTRADLTAPRSRRLG